MLAEWENRDLHAEAFDMTYAWSWNDAVHQITQGKADVNSLYVYYSWNEKAFPKDGYRALFVSNHDKNAWEGTEFEQFGAGLETAIVLSVVSEGMPLIYNGQEAGNPRRLAFFDRDPIDWRDHHLGALYKKSLFALKKQNTALWNGKWGARMINVFNDAPGQVLSFVRQNDQDKVFAMFNFSAAEQTVTFQERLHHGVYCEAFSGKPVSFDATTSLTVEPWGCRVYVK
jgi:glycosidase